MRILHLMLSNFYIDGYNYQENAIPRQNKKDGHDVKIIASTETFLDNRKIGYLQPSEYINEDGISVTRVAYKPHINKKIANKVRVYKDVYQLIEGFSPDVILFHGIVGYELLTVVKYKKKHPNIKLYVDNHGDFNNSAHGAFSKVILHKFFYKSIIKKALPYIDKVFYITYECKEFLRIMYQIPEDMMEYYPLGGTIIEEERYHIIRTSIRDSLSLKNDNILYIHAGKMDKLKRTIEILTAFKRNKDKNSRLIIIGTLSNDIEDDVRSLISSDNRISYLGWKSPEEINEYLCAADIYIQPGSQSAIMQNAICCGCVVALYPHKSHKYLLGDKAFYIESIDDMVRFFDMISNNPSLLKEKRMQTNEVRNLLDYKVLGSRLYH